MLPTKLPNLLKKYWWASVAAFYLAFRLPFLTRLAVFNDEAVYLDWGYRAWLYRDMVWYALRDGKTPLLMWVFGLVQRAPIDPLLAGRLVAVAGGAVTLLGLLVLMRRLSVSRPTQVLIAMLYCVTPWFAFYDRQALMESAVSAVTVWLAVVLLAVMKLKLSWRWGVVLGGLAAVGLWIKTSSLVPVIAVLTLFVISRINLRNKPCWRQDWPAILIILGTGLTVATVMLLPLILQPEANLILLRHDRYTLSPQEGLVSFGQHIMTNVAAVAEIWWAHASPLIAMTVLLSVAWLIWHWQRQNRQVRYLITYCLLLMAGFVISVRSPSARYLAPFAPIVLLLVAVAIKPLSWQRQVGLLVLPLLAGAMFTSWSFLRPANYFDWLAQLSPQYSQRADYITNWTAGWAVTASLKWLQSQQLPHPTYVALRPDAGNPESTVLVRLRTPQFAVRYMGEVPLMGNDQGCRTFSPNTILVSRDAHLEGTDAYWQELARFPNPGGLSSVGLYAPQLVCPSPTPMVTRPSR